MNISSRLKKIRNKRNLSQYVLSKKTGVSQSFISALETGNKTATIKTMEKLCIGLGISLAEFFSEKQNNYPDYLRPLLKEARYLTPEQSKKLASFMSSLRDQSYQHSN